MGEETSKKRLDRELIELLNELRILLPGVQVLFAFLLTVPFNTGFSNATTFHRSLLLVALPPRAGEGWDGGAYPHSNRLDIAGWSAPAAPTPALPRTRGREFSIAT